VRGLYAKALEKGRTILTEYESKKILAAYNIPGGTTELAITPEEAVKAAQTIGYPVVLKVFFFFFFLVQEKIFLFIIIRYTPKQLLINLMLVVLN
jgi:hypothetical protein